MTGGTIELAGVSTLVDQIYSGPVELEGDLITGGGVVTFNDAVLLLHDVLIDTTGAGAFPSGAGVFFNGPIDALDLGFLNLTVEAGTSEVEINDTVTRVNQLAVSGGSIGLAA